MDALVFAGVDEVTVKAGGKELQKAVPAEKMGLLFDLLGAQTYYKFVMRYRNFRNIANTLSAAKPMVAIDINDLDQNEFLLNTPDSTINLKEGLSGVQECWTANLRRHKQRIIFLIFYSFDCAVLPANAFFYQKHGTLLSTGRLL